MAYTRGVVTTGAGSYGYVQSLSVNDGGEELLIKDEDGITQVEQLYDEMVEVTVTAKYDRAQTLPSRGDTLTLAAAADTTYNGKYSITGITVDESNVDAATLTLTLRRFIDGGIPT